MQALTAEQAAQPYDAFLRALSEQLRSCRRLLHLGSRKQEALAAWDLRSIEEILAAEREALAKLGAAESAQARVAPALAIAVGLEPAAGYEAITIRLEEPGRSAARELLDQLGETTAQLAAVSECNTQLIRRAQSYIEFRLGQAGRAMTGAQGAPSYNHRGAAANAGMPPTVSRQY